jgi:hypothetical protein
MLSRRTGGLGGPCPQSNYMKRNPLAGLKLETLSYLARAGVSETLLAINRFEVVGAAVIAGLSILDSLSIAEYPLFMRVWRTLGAHNIYQPALSRCVPQRWRDW